MYLEVELRSGWCGLLRTALQTLAAVSEEGSWEIKGLVALPSSPNSRLHALWWDPDQSGETTHGTLSTHLGPCLVVS